ncbi:tRNA(fMet)-specific endonuclease VapC [Inquilinus ginsengisoli]|jgi:tRNA(fMet)-specific endonuclease VapC|uniref:type II toxin-antitoxin system tRNA(fMet)-specific endonuclease VapC n=1 Tax=Inquilinus ginsengisoli TaxID=363840 RepID=UPI003D2481F3
MAVVRYLLDTSICIYIRRRRPPEVLARFEKLKPGEAGLSVITCGELLYGVEKNQSQTKAMQLLREMLALLPVLPLPAEVGEAYGAIRADLETRGQVIGNNDLWIAAHAKAAKLTLVTNNEKEFRRIGGLKIQNWIN